MEEKLLDNVIEIKEQIGEIHGTMNAVLVQVEKTNGRVTLSEKTVSELAKICSQNSGQLIAIWDRLEKEKGQKEESEKRIRSFLWRNGERIIFLIILLTVSFLGNPVLANTVNNIISIFH